eukprot:7808447-Lingulodinium_polyedra.AAC.1
MAPRTPFVALAKQQKSGVLRAFRFRIPKLRKPRRACVCIRPEVENEDRKMARNDTHGRTLPWGAQHNQSWRTAPFPNGYGLNIS